VVFSPFGIRFATSSWRAVSQTIKDIQGL